MQQMTVDIRRCWRQGGQTIHLTMALMRVRGRMLIATVRIDDEKASA